MSTELEQLKIERDRQHDYACRMDALAEERLSELVGARTRIEAVREIHKPFPIPEGFTRERSYCSACVEPIDGMSEPWPCPTVRALEESR